MRVGPHGKGEGRHRERDRAREQPSDPRAHRPQPRARRHRPPRPEAEANRRRHPHPSLALVGRQRRPRAHERRDRLVKVTGHRSGVSERRAVAVGQAEDGRGRGLAQRADPPGRAGQRERDGGPGQRASRPPHAARGEEERGRDGDDGGERHQVRPDGEPGQSPQRRQPSARGHCATGEAIRDVDREDEHHPEQHECRRVQGRRQGGEEQHVGGRTGHEEARGQARPRQGRLSQAIGDPDQAQRQQRVRDAQGGGRGAERGHEGGRDPAVQGRAVRLAPEGGAARGMARHEADDGRVAIHAGVEGLPPERQP